MRLERLRLQPDDRLRFLHAFIRRPQQVGSIIPSSRFLERKVVQLAGIRSARTVVELGPGTGGTTRALLAAAPPGCTLLCVEINPDFVRVLRGIRDERLRVYRGSAERLAEALAEHGMPSADAVVSGIPFSTIGDATGTRVLRSIRSVLSPGGRFVAYQVRDRVRELGESVFGPARTELELLNIPPVRVFHWAKPATPEPRRRRAVADESFLQPAAP